MPAGLRGVAARGTLTRPPFGRGPALFFPLVVLRGVLPLLWPLLLVVLLLLLLLLLLVGNSTTAAAGGGKGMGCWYVDCPSVTGWLDNKWSLVPIRPMLSASKGLGSG